MSNLKLGDWETSTPVQADSGTAEILGTIYPWKKMPDGKYWIAQNFAWVGTGFDYAGDSGNRAAYGRLYQYTQLATITASLDGNFRVPVRADWDALFAAVGGIAVAARKLKEPGTAHWTAPNSATGDYGFAVRGAGYRWFPYGNPVGYFSLNHAARFVLLDGYAAYGDTYQYISFYENNSHCEIPSVADSNDALSLRLISDIQPPIPPTHRSGTHDILILPSGQAETTESLAQRVDIRLRTFIGEHWLNPELGVPWFEEFLRKAPDLAACRQILVAVLQDVPGVVSVDSLTVTLDKSPRQMRVSFVVSGTDSIPQSGTTAVLL